MITNARIPLVDLVALHHEMEEELVSVFKTVLKTAAFVGGPMELVTAKPLPSSD